MMGTMKWVGLDVHARSTHAAALDAGTGELSRVRFGAGVDAPVQWLQSLPGPVRACYEAGPTGFGLYRALPEAGIAVQVIAPGKTPRGPSDRVKTDRKDAELLARQLLAGSLTTVVVPAPEVEAARELTRAHDVCRQELIRARHRVSKMLLRHGVVYPKAKTWTAEHSATWQHETGPWGTQPPHHQTGNRRHRARRPDTATKPLSPAPPDAITHTHLTNQPTYQL